jgi:hypothetical protein
MSASSSGAAPMKISLVGSFAELHEEFSHFPNNDGWIFRGVASPAWRLVPSIGRATYSAELEKRMLDMWKSRAVPYLPAIQDDWDWLTIAQHRGLRTRLLDWTTSPLVAAYFADGGCIYAFRTQKRARTVESPLEFTGVALFEPREVATRVTHQRSTFTIHGPPTLAVDEAMDGTDELHQIIVLERYAPTLRQELKRYGIDDYSLFPDLEGLVRFINSQWPATTPVASVAQVEEVDEKGRPIDVKTRAQLAFLVSMEKAAQERLGKARTKDERSERFDDLSRIQSQQQSLELYRQKHEGEMLELQMHAGFARRNQTGHS